MLAQCVGDAIKFGLASIFIYVQRDCCNILQQSYLLEELNTHIVSLTSNVAYAALSIQNKHIRVINLQNRFLLKFVERLSPFPKFAHQ